MLRIVGVDGSCNYCRIVIVLFSIEYLSIVVFVIVILTCAAIAFSVALYTAIVVSPSSLSRLVGGITVEFRSVRCEAIGIYVAASNAIAYRTYEPFEPALFADQN